MEKLTVLFKSEYTECIDVEEYETYLYIQAVIVKAEYRNKGIGTKIMLDIMRYAKTKGKPILAFASNELGGDIDTLFSWYGKLGFYKEYNILDTAFNYNIRLDSKETS